MSHKRTVIWLRWSIAMLPLLILIALARGLEEQTLYIIWKVTLGFTALFYIACALIPAFIRRLQSMPYTYSLSNNWGPAGLEAQLLTYASYHTHWYNHITHTAFPIESILWQLVLYSYLLMTFNPIVAFIILVSTTLILTLQAYSFQEKILARTLTLWWCCVALLALVTTHFLPVQLCYRWSVILLLSMGFWRFTGHWFEPIPPAVLNNNNFVTFQQAGFNLKLLAPTLLGFFSEFAAGLPFRLVVVWIYVGLQQRLPETKFNFSWLKSKNIRIEIHQKGWQAHPRTKKLIEREIGVYDGGN